MKLISVVLLVTAVVFASNYLGDGTGTANPQRQSLVVLDSFNPEAVLSVYLVGLGYDPVNGQFWVANNHNAGGGGQNEIGVFEGTSPYNLVTTFTQNSTSGWGILDMAYDDGYMFVTDFNAVVFNYYNVNTWEKEGSFNGYGSGSYACATDGAGTFYTGDFNTSGNVYSAVWDGVSGSSPSWSVFTSPPLGETGILGAAYDPGWPCLWVSSSSGAGSIFQVAMDGSLMEWYNQAAQGANPAGTHMAPFGGVEKLWVLIQADPDQVWCFDSDVALQRSTWGTIKTMF